MYYQKIVLTLLSIGSKIVPRRKLTQNWIVDFFNVECYTFIKGDVIMIFAIPSLFLAVFSLILSIQAFLGKDVILNNTYRKASEEERKNMNKKAYSVQSAVIFLFIFIISLLNTIRAFVNVPWLTYATAAAFVVLVVYFFVSNHKLKK